MNDDANGESGEIHLNGAPVANGDTTNGISTNTETVTSANATANCRRLSGESLDLELLGLCEEREELERHSVELSRKNLQKNIDDKKDKDKGREKEKDGESGKDEPENGLPEASVLSGETTGEGGDDGHRKARSFERLEGETNYKRMNFRERIADLGLWPAISHVVWHFLKNNWGILLFLTICVIGLILLGIFRFDPLSWKAWAAFGVVLVALALLIKNAFSSQIIMLAALTVMLLLKIVTPDESLRGFANDGVASVAVLFIVAEGIQRTSVLMPVFRFILGKPKHLIWAQLRLLTPVAIVSAFLNNTPVVAMMIPVVQKWSRRAGFPISKLLMPMNDIAILAGTCTLLGTSTNLVVASLAKENADELGIDGTIPIFGISRLGLPLLAVGVVYVVIASRFLLKDRGQSGVDDLIENPKEYTVALRVQERSPIVGETVSEAGLRQLQGLFLVELTRDNGDVIPAVSPETRIMAGDILLFAGIVETVKELYHIQGLVPATAQSNKIRLERHRRRLVELVVGPASVLTGRSVKESKFRSRYRGAIIAVHRRGERVKEKIADIVLQSGDTLLVETGEDFVEHHRSNGDFALVSEVSGSQPPREDWLHMAIAAITTVAMVSLVVSKVLPLLTASAAAAFIMIITRCLSSRNAAQSVNLPVIITIAASFGVSRGMEVTGAADQLASVIVDVFQRIGTIGILFGIYIATALMSAVITNNAAVILMFPVVLRVKKEQGLSGLAALYTLMLAASSSFNTPIGYQTNLMVHGPGGYTFLDWIVFGTPLQFILGIIAVVLVNFYFPS